MMTLIAGLVRGENSDCKRPMQRYTPPRELRLQTPQATVHSYERTHVADAPGYSALL